MNLDIKGVGRVLFRAHGLPRQNREDNTVQNDPSIKTLSGEQPASAQFFDCETIGVRQLAKLLKVSPSTVYQGKLTQGGPPAIFVSLRRRRYRLRDVEVWLESLTARDM